MCPDFSKVALVLWHWGTRSCREPVVVALEERDASGGLDNGGGTGDKSKKADHSEQVTSTAPLSWMWGEGEEPRTAPRFPPFLFLA